MHRREGISRRDVLRGGMAGGILFAFSIPLAACGENRPADADRRALPPNLADTPALESWIRITADGRVTVITGKAELGQGILTACIQIAADELDVDPGRMDIVAADTDRSPDEAYTFGSLSVQQSGMAIRQAAAELRYLLLRRAADRFGSDTDGLTVADGEIRGAAGAVSYWQLAEEAPFKAEATGRATPKPPAARRLSGTDVPRVDIPDKVFGRPRFVQDLRLEGMLHARVARPPSYQARLASLDDVHVRAMPGVVEVIRDGSFLAVAATREEQVIAAADALRAAAEWTGGTALPDPAGLVETIIDHPDAEVSDITPDNLQGGPALSAGPALQARYTRPFQAHAAIAPSAAVARMQGGRLTVWSHTQGVYPLRAALAQALEMAADDIRVIHMEGAGCYGQNAADDAALDAALICRAIGGRAVRLQYMRADEFLWEPYGPAMVLDAAARLNDDGRIAHWRYDVHGYPHTARPGPGRAGNLVSAQLKAKAIPQPPHFNIPQPNGGLDRNAVPSYDLPAGRIVEHFIPDPPLRVGALRALGAYANVFAIESFMDELAYHAGRDPLVFRLEHLSEPRARAVLERAAESAGWGNGKSGPGRGQGIAWARYKNSGGWLAVVVTLEADTGSGEIRLLKAVAAADCGEIVNPDGARNQIEGGLLQAASWTLTEAVEFTPDGLASTDWASYPVLTFDRMPEVEVILIDRPEQPPLGAGEVAQGPMAAAIANATFDATGLRLRDLPLTPARLKQTAAVQGA